MMEEQPRRGFGRAIQIALLLFILIVSPALSWYYLRSGVDYRKAALSELKDYGALSFLDWNIINRPNYVVADSIKDKIVIMGIVRHSGTQAEQVTTVMNKVFDQFRERRDVLFTTFLTNTDSLSALAYAQKNNPRNYPNYWFVQTNSTTYPSVLSGLKLAQKGDFSTTECPYIIYVNAKGVVSNFYDVHDKQQLGRLIEHIAMKLKIDKFETPEVIRDKEK
jgi:hypothetical protein